MTSPTPVTLGARTLAEAKDAVHRTCLELLERGLVVGSAGNVSVRHSPDEAVLSAGGTDYRELAPDDHPSVDLRSGAVDGGRAPTSEFALHTELLRAMPEVGAAVHTHSPYAAAFAVARVDLGFIMNENLGPRAERILVTAPYCPPGTQALAEAALETFDRQPGSRAVLLANHGLLAVGDTAAAALLVAAQVEWIAQVTQLAHALGGAHTLTRAQQRAICANYGVTLATEPTVHRRRDRRGRRQAE